MADVEPQRTVLKASEQPNRNSVCLLCDCVKGD